MSNRVIIKFSFIAAMFVFASCHNEVPELPSPDQVSEFEFCGYEVGGDYKCKSTYEISPADCTTIGGNLFPDMASCNKGH